MEDWQIVVIVALLLFLSFRRRIWGVLDPLFLFLAIRIATAITVSAQYLFSPDLAAPGVLHMTLCLFVFTISLWASSPKIEQQKHAEVDLSVQVRYLFRIGLGVLLFKALILLSVYNELPIIAGEMGSDSYIEFDMGNKVASALLLGIGSFDTVLLACVVPLLASKKKRLIGWLALIVSLSSSILVLKKGGFLMALVAVALGEYLRLYLIDRKARIFVKPVIMGTGLFIATIWAYVVYSSTAGNIEFENINDILNFVSFQFMYPYFLYANGDIFNFAQDYHFNRLLYFFHSLSSPLGYPAFHASIGPALQEYETGVITGNGINPTFIIEGYVVFGKAISVFYALLLGISLGLVRRALLTPSNDIVKKVALTALLLPPLYVLPIDSLLAIKELLVCFFMIACYVFAVGSLNIVRAAAAAHKYLAANKV